jgi:gliding motility-associated-like protein
VNNETPTDLTGTLSIVRAPGESVGTYVITASGYTSTNYTIAYVPGVFEITDNIPPTVITQNITVFLDANGTVQITPNEIDNGSFDDSGIASMILDITSFDCENLGENTVALTVTDNNGNQATAFAVVNVADNTLPTIISQSVTISLDDQGQAVLLPSQVDAGSFDNCEIVSIAVSPSDFSCSDEGLNIVTLTVIDSSGNIATSQVEITVLNPSPDTDGDGIKDNCDDDDDNDGLSDEEEALLGTDPLNPDTDGDGVMDGVEVADNTDPLDGCSFVLSSQTLTPSTLWSDSDCDGDGVTNGQEIIDGTDLFDACSLILSNQTLESPVWDVLDCDGDGVSNLDEILDGTDPEDACSSVASSITLPLSQDFLDGDCDGDGLSNGDEIGPDPTRPIDSNGNGIPDYLEVNNHQPMEDDLEVYTLVTPNGDGDNDVLVIRNIELYPENTLEVYNRWGVKVYGTQGYGQRGNYFRGISEGRVTVSTGSELPAATYWYVLRYKNSEGIWKERVGYLYLNR